MSDFLARIKPRRSTVAGEKPSSLDLQVAEIALNTADGKIFTKHTDGSIKEISGSGGGGGGGSISAVEDIGNVQARQTVPPGVLSWDVKDDENVAGGWRYDDGAFQLSLNKEAKNGFDIRPSVVAMPTTGTIWISFDNLAYTEIAYTSRVINTEVVIVDLVVTAPDDGFPSEVYVAFDNPYADGASFEKDILLYDVSENAWIPTPLTVNAATDWDTEGEGDIGLQDGMSMVWSAEKQKWTQGFPVLSSGGKGGGAQTSTSGYGYMVGPNSFFSLEGVDPLSTGWNSLGKTGDDNVFNLTVPSPLVGTEFFEQAIPATIQFCTNGNIHWDATRPGSSGGRSGNFLTDSESRDFWLAFWSQDTASNGVWEKWDGDVWTIRIEFKIPYNQSSGSPVEVQLSRQGGLRVSYGLNNGDAINTGIALQGVASNGIALVEGFGSASNTSGAWSWASLVGDGTGRGTKDLLDVSSYPPEGGQILTFDLELKAYKPADPPVISVNGGTGEVVLGYEDLNNYALAEALPAPYEYTFTTGGETGPTDGQMSFATVSGEVEFKEIILQSDANGRDPAGVFSNGDQIWMGIDGATPQAYTIVDVGELGPPGGTELEVSEDLPTEPAEGTPVLVYASDPSGTVPIPLVEGDVLRYDGSNFSPIALELNSLSDVDVSTSAPADGQSLIWDDAGSKWKPGTVSGGGGGGAVDSVNGETGAVSLGIQEMDDFELNESSNVVEATYVITANTSVGAGQIRRVGSAFYIIETSQEGYAPLDIYSDGQTIWMQEDGEAVLETTIDEISENNSGDYVLRTVDDYDIGSSGGLTVYNYNPDGVPKAVLAEGDILQWNDADQKFKPVQIEGVSNAVTSVNGETGVVSLGIQEMDDFELKPDPSALIYRYDTVSCSGSVSATDDPGECSCNNSHSPRGGRWTFCNTDSQGYDFGAEAQALDDAGRNDPYLIWFSGDGQNWFPSTTSSVSGGSTYCQIYLENDQVFDNCSLGNTQIYVTFVDPTNGLQSIPLAEGDILQWSNTDQKFKPAQLPAAPVDSVNGETGVVSLGIQEMDDFALRPNSSEFSDLTLKTDSKPPNQSGEWYIENSNASFRYVAWSRQQDSRMNLLQSGDAVTFKAPGVSDVVTTLTMDPTPNTATDSFVGTGIAWPQEWLDLPEGTPLTIEASAFAVGTEPLAEGDILQWNDADQKFKPAQLPAGGGGGAVDSVNGETGVVSLGIQDMDDFGLLPADAYRFDGYAGHGRGPGAYGVTSASLKFNETDSDGKDCSAVFSTASTPFTVYYKYSADDAPRSAICDTVFGPDANGQITLSVDAITGAAGSSLTISLASLAGGGVPLTEGDILQWNNADQKFKPAQLPAGPERQTATATLTGAENGTDYDTEIDGLGNAGTFLKVSTSHAAWVRFYSDPDSRTADVSRGQTDSPARGSGVLLELITIGSEVYKITPAVSYINLTDDLDGKLYVRVANLSGATEDITVDVTALVIEA